MSGDCNEKCCSHQHTGTPSVYQTLDELDFERGIWSAALDGNLEKVEQLLNKGTEPSARDISGYTALHYASRSGHTAVCQLLLRRGASANEQTPGGSTPLHRAALRGHLGLLEILLRNGADPSISDSDGKTPLHKAAEGGREGVVKRLLEADPSAKLKRDLRGRFPFDCLSSNQQPLSSLLLVD